MDIIEDNVPENARELRTQGTKYHDVRGKPLIWLRAALREWAKLVDQYVYWHDGDDAPYFYNEQANVGFLASAACMSGLLALSEYGANKQKAEGKKYIGRSDLYICQKKGTYAAFEAKQLWLTEDAVPHAASLIDDALGDATDDAERGDRSCDMRVGAVFATYKADIGTSLEDIKGNCARMVRAATRCSDAVAWSFPESALKLKDIDRWREEFRWPGVILALRSL